MSTTTDDLLTTLTTLTTSLSSTLTSLPHPDDSASIAPPQNGISLLDVKNDVLLSYLHNLVFLALLRLRSGPIASHAAIDDLIKLRLLLERGVKPLEQKLKYQIDKVVIAAAAASAAEGVEGDTGLRTINDSGSSGEESGAGEGEDDDIIDSESGDEDDAAARKRLLSAAAAPSPSDLVHRPNPSSLLLVSGKKTPTAAAAAAAKGPSSDGIYRPPRIAATSMPETTTSRERKERAPLRNHALDDFVGEELSATPIAVPSIGTTIVQSGRAHKTSRDRKAELERQEFEEANLMRLPKVSRKEMQASRKQNRGARENAFGGEDWRSLAGDLDRLTKNVGKEGRGEKALERSRKRGGGDEGEGRGIGKHYEGRKGLANKRRRI